MAINRALEAEILRQLQAKRKVLTHAPIVGKSASEAEKEGTAKKARASQKTAARLQINLTKLLRKRAGLPPSTAPIASPSAGPPVPLGMYKVTRPGGAVGAGPQMLAPATPAAPATPGAAPGVTPLGSYPVGRLAGPPKAPAPTGGQSHEFSQEATGHALGVFPAKPGGTGWQLLADHFNIPHSGNDGGPFAQFGQVWYNHDDGKYYLGLAFIGGKRFRYERRPFDSSQEVIASLAGYTSISWAANPKSSHYDGARFGPGTYTRV